MKTVKKSTFSKIVFILCVFLMLLLGAESVCAGIPINRIIFKPKKTMVFDTSQFGYIYLKGIKKNEEIVSVKPNKKEYVSIYNFGDGRPLYIHFEKPGKLKLTFTIKNKKTRKKRKTFVYIKILDKKKVKPFKYFTVDGKNILKKDSYGLSIGTKKESLKIRYKLNKNWKIMNKKGYFSSDSKSYQIFSSKIFKSNTAFRKPYHSYVIYLKNKKTNQETFTGLYVYEEIEEEEYYGE